MVRTPSHPERDNTAEPSLWRRLTQLAGIWTTSVPASGIAARLIRLFMSAVGLGVPH